MRHQFLRDTAATTGSSTGERLGARLLESAYLFTLMEIVRENELAGKVFLW